jgi:hypothetical protein
MTDKCKSSHGRCRRQGLQERHQVLWAPYPPSSGERMPNSLFYLVDMFWCNICQGGSLLLHESLRELSDSSPQCSRDPSHAGQLTDEERVEIQRYREVALARQAQRDERQRHRQPLHTSLSANMVATTLPSSLPATPVRSSLRPADPIQASQPVHSPQHSESSRTSTTATMGKVAAPSATRAKAPTATTGSRTGLFDAPVNHTSWQAPQGMHTAAPVAISVFSSQSQDDFTFMQLPSPARASRSSHEASPLRYAHTLEPEQASFEAATWMSLGSTRSGASDAAGRERERTSVIHDPRLWRRYEPTAAPTPALTPAPTPGPTLGPTSTLTPSTSLATAYSSSVDSHAPLAAKEQRSPYRQQTHTSLYRAQTHASSSHDHLAACARGWITRRVFTCDKVDLLVRTIKVGVWVGSKGVSRIFFFFLTTSFSISITRCANAQDSRAVLADLGTPAEPDRAFAARIAAQLAAAQCVLVLCECVRMSVCVGRLGGTL